MAFNIGINPIDGKCVAANSKDKENEVITICTEKISPDDIEKIDNLFKYIISYLCEKVTSACIYLNDKYCNDIRIHFLKSAKNHGIQNVCIIDFSTALFFHALHESSYKLQNGDKIGIIWSKRCYIFKYTINVAFLDSYSYVSSEDQSMVKKLEAPTVMFFNDKNVSKYYLHPKFYIFSDFTPENGALIKAQYVINKINEYSWIISKCGRKIEVFLDDKSLLTVLPIKTLPYADTIKIEKTGKSFIFKIVENDALTKEFKICVSSIIFGINSMGIYYIKNMDYTELIDVKDHNESEAKEPRNTHLRQKIMSRKNPKTITERFSCPTFETKTMSNYVEDMQQIDHIQTELNILENFVSDGYSDFDFDNIEHMCTKVSAYEATVAILEKLLEKAKIYNRDKNNKKRASSIHNTTDSALFQCATLKENLKNLKIFLQLADTYLALYNKEIKWITENSFHDDIKFEYPENVETAIKNIAKLNGDFKKHKNVCDKVVSDGKEIIKKVKKNHVKIFINEFNRKFEEVENLIEWYNKIAYIFRTIDECNKKGETIKKWIKDKEIFAHRNYKKQMNPIICEDLRHFLSQIEEYWAVISQFEKETNDIINKIEKSENQIKTKFMVSIDYLQNLKNDINDAYFKLKENLTTKIKKMKDEKMLEFINSFNAIEKLINETKNLVKNFEIRRGELEKLELYIVEIVEAEKNRYEEKIEELVKSALNPIIFGLNETKIILKNVESLRSEANNLIAEKFLQIRNMKNILKFFDDSKAITALATYKINSLNAVRHENHLSTLKNEYKQVHENILELIKRGKSLKLKDENQANKIETQIQELQKVYDMLKNLVATKIQEFDKEKELSIFFNAAEKTHRYLENAILELEMNAKSNLPLKIIMKKHLQHRNQLLENKSKIENLMNLGERLLKNKKDLKNVNKMLNKVTTAVEAFDSMWQQQFEIYDELKFAETFNFEVDKNMKFLEEYFILIRTNSVTPAIIDEKNTAVNMEILKIEKMAKREKFLDQNLKNNVASCINEITKMKQKVEALTNKFSYNLRQGSSFNGQPSTFQRKPSRRLTTFSSCSTFQNLEYESYFIPTKVEFYKEEIDAIGMDLGTTRCCMAIKRNNRIDTIALDNNGERLLPSIVSFDDEVATCGKNVLERLPKTNARYTCFDVKRIIGKSRCDVVQDDSWPFDIIENGEDVLIKLASNQREVTKTPEEVSAVLLKHMKESASTLEGKEVTKAVLTVPAAFTERQERATLEAAKLAGWKEIELLPEPVAAAFAYFHNTSIPDNSNILLFDLGGGTLDVCLFQIVDGNLEIVSNVGDTCLGGRDIDNLLIDHFTKVLEFRYDIILKEKEKKRYRLMLECQRIKHSLTASEEELFDVQNFNENKKETIIIRREELEKMVLKMNLKSRMVTLINQNLFKAQMTQKEIDKVLQVGGGCRMPLIKNMLKEMFPNAEHCCVEQPDEIVATGAAIYAYHLATLNANF